MAWPQITYIALSCAGLGVSLAKHGEARPPYSFWNASIGAAIAFGLLYAGGFFGVN